MYLGKNGGKKKISSKNTQYIAIAVVAIISYGSGTILILFFLPYALGMLFANLIDIIDWLILRQIHRIKLKTEELDWTKNYFFHNIIAKIRKYALFWLPNWNYEKKAIIPEIIINVILIIGIILLRI